MNTFEEIDHRDAEEIRLAKEKADFLKKKYKRQGRKSKSKGKRGERGVAQMYYAYGFPARRGVQYQGGVGSPDVVVDIISDYFHHEVKFVEKLNLTEALAQAKTDAGDTKIPIVVHKKSRQGWLTTLSFNTFLDILQVCCDRVKEGNKLGEVFEEIRRRYTESESNADLESDSELL